MVGW
ncbi:hypothetical protein ID866_8444 [Astraeus odoratus]|jgi:hypothetical protein